MSPAVDVLVPTRHRPTALAATLATLIGQTWCRFDVVVSDQSDDAASFDTGEARSIVRVLEARGHGVRLLRNLPRRGLAQQRQFLLDHAHAPYVLYLDDDVLLEPEVIERLAGVLRQQRCGFAGSAVIGLSYRDDMRPDQQAVEFWDGAVQPEQVRPRAPQWRRHLLHNAANLWHVQRALGVDAAHPRLYKLAWAGGCVMYDAAKLREAGGFEFWRDLPDDHCGEDVLAQLRVMARWGGCGVMPSGAYHQELPTLVPCREVDAPYTLYADPSEAGA